MSALPNVGVRRKWLRLIFPAGELGQVTPRSSLLHRVFCSIRLNHSTKGHRPELPQVCPQTKGEGMTYSIWMYGCEKKGCVTATTTLTDRNNQGHRLAKRVHRGPACLLPPSLQVSWTWSFPAVTGSPNVCRYRIFCVFFKIRNTFKIYSGWKIS